MVQTFIDPEEEGFRFENIGGNGVNACKLHFTF